MPAQDCIDEINAAAGRTLADDEIEEILDRMEARVKTRKAEAKLKSLEEDLFDEADALAAEAAEAAAIERRNALMNIRVWSEWQDFVRVAEEKTGDPAAPFRARNVGSNQVFPDARESAGARGDALFNGYMGGMIADMKRDQVFEFFVSGALDREVARELEQLTRPNGRPGVSGSEQAQKIAATVDKYRKLKLARENRAGAWRKPLEGYVGPQYHNMGKVRRATYEGWRDTIMTGIDAERTFGAKDPDAVMRGIYDGISTGHHIRANGAEESDLTLAFKGPGNLARRVSEHRILHFKDAEAWADYNERFGAGTLRETIVREFERSARNTALMETWGPNPEAMFDRALRDAKDRHRGDPKAIEALNAPALRHQFAVVDGTTRIPVAPTSAKVTSTVLGVQAMAKLGGATISAIADLAFKIDPLLRLDNNYLAAWGRNFESALAGLSGPEKRRVGDLMGVGLDGQIGEVASRFMILDDIPGSVAKMQQVFFKLNLLGPWTDGNKLGIGNIYAHHFGTLRNTAWDSVEPGLREFMGLYGLDADKWRVARLAVRPEGDGQLYMMPDGIADLSDAELKAIPAYADMSPRQLRAVRDDVETALRSLYVDVAEEAIPTPGARERAFLTQGTQPGTPLGTAVRLVAQFKAFPTTVLIKGMGRRMQADTTRQFFAHLASGKGSRLALVHMIVATTLLGYAAQSAKEIAKGRSPRDPTDWETWGAAMTQGGGMGIYGDFLFGEYNRFGRSALETAAGPTLGTSADLLELWSRLRAGDDTGAAGFRMLMQNAPFVNIPYIRQPLDWLLIYQWQEQMNPGYLRRMERRVERDQGQSFIMPPSRAIPRGGGRRAFEGVR